MDDEGIRVLVKRLARPHPSGGDAVERAAILAEGEDFPSIMSWISEHEGVPESAVVAAPRGLHGARVGGGPTRPPLRYVLPRGLARLIQGSSSRACASAAERTTSARTATNRAGRSGFPSSPNSFVATSSRQPHIASARNARPAITMRFERTRCAACRPWQNRKRCPRRARSCIPPQSAARISVTK